MSYARQAAPRLGAEGLESRLVPVVAPCLGAISGMVYVDANANAAFDAGDTPLQGVKLSLVDASGTVVKTATTGADGRYAFADVLPAPYTVREAQPAGYRDGPDYAGAVNGVPSGTPTGADEITGVDLPNCGTGTGYDFTERPVPPPPVETTGREGLTPGYWKNNATKFDGSAWAPTGYFMYQTVGSVFNFTGTAYSGLAGKTLVQALSLPGGGVNALLRSATAAVLNAAHPAVDYPLTTQQIVARVNAALAGGSDAQIEALKNELDGYNNLGANLDQHGRVV